MMPKFLNFFKRYVFRDLRLAEYIEGEVYPRLLDSFLFSLGIFWSDYMINQNDAKFCEHYWT